MYIFRLYIYVFEKYYTYITLKQSPAYRKVASRVQRTFSFPETFGGKLPI